MDVLKEFLGVANIELAHWKGRVVQLEKKVSLLGGGEAKLRERSLRDTCMVLILRSRGCDVSNSLSLCASSIIAHHCLPVTDPGEGPVEAGAEPPSTGKKVRFCDSCSNAPRARVLGLLATYAGTFVRHNNFADLVSLCLPLQLYK